MPAAGVQKWVDSDGRPAGTSAPVDADGRRPVTRFHRLTGS